MFLLLIASRPATALAERSPAQPAVASKPLFVDPIFDGAADPCVVWDRASERWRMFYTARRAKLPGQLVGFEWVHGTRVGVAETRDAGASWAYRGVADIELRDGEETHWAPEIIHDGKTYHLFLTHVPGVFADWDHPRELVQLTSQDLATWRPQRKLSFGSGRVIDADVLRLEDGRWRLWYNDEAVGKSIGYADSDDLSSWRDRGLAIEGTPCEGPVAFRWRDRYWMLTDEWRGLAVYHSDDAEHWTRQDGDNLLAEPGSGQDDGVKGGHPDVVVNGGRAYLFYFTHPGRSGGEPFSGPAQRRSVIQVAELRIVGDRLTCDRDALVSIHLRPPD